MLCVLAPGKGVHEMHLIDPKLSVADEYNQLELKRAKQVVQIYSSLALVLSVLAVAVAIGGIFTLLWALVTFAAWLF